MLLGSKKLYVLLLELFPIEVGLVSFGPLIEVNVFLVDPFGFSVFLEAKMSSFLVSSLN